MAFPSQTDFSATSEAISEFKLCQEVDFPMPNMMGDKES